MNFHTKNAITARAAIPPATDNPIIVALLLLGVSSAFEDRVFVGELLGATSVIVIVSNSPSSSVRTVSELNLDVDEVLEGSVEVGVVELELGGVVDAVVHER